MARINIEECWWTDPRRSKLIKLMGGDEERADGAAVRMWRLAQEFWKHDHQPVPEHIFRTLETAEHLLGAGLAVLGEGSVYVRGSSQWLDWVRERSEKAKVNGAKGGKVSAQRPRDALGRLLEKGANVQAPAKHDPSESKPSYSSSSSKRSNTYTPRFLEIWDKYPGKGRINKPVAFKRYQSQIKTDTDGDDLALAVANYSSYLAKETWRSPKQFDSFLGTERSGYFWQQFIDPDPLLWGTPSLAYTV